MIDIEYCPCGEPLHYLSLEAWESVNRLIVEHGYTINVQVGEVAYAVPRHYIALHGLRAAEVPELAQRYDWDRVR